MRRKDLIIPIVILSACAIFGSYMFIGLARSNDRMLEEINCDRLYEAEQNGTDLSEYSDVPELRMKCAKLNLAFLFSLLFLIFLRYISI